jgi:hypothetical protein
MFYLLSNFNFVYVILFIVYLSNISLPWMGEG